MVPTVAADLVAHARSSGLISSSLRALVLGGSPPPAELIRALDALGVPVFQGWGMTEIRRWRRSPAHRQPPTTTRLAYQVHPETGQVAARIAVAAPRRRRHRRPHDGMTSGEVLIRGPWVATEYFRDPHPEAFVDGWLRTGDIGVIDDHGYWK